MSFENLDHIKSDNLRRSKAFENNLDASAIKWGTDFFGRYVITLPDCEMCVNHRNNDKILVEVLSLDQRMYKGFSSPQDLKDAETISFASLDALYRNIRDIVDDLEILETWKSPNSVWTLEVLRCRNMLKVECKHISGWKDGYGGVGYDSEVYWLCPNKISEYVKQKARELAQKYQVKRVS